jgi:hypothetical protein
MYTEDAVKREKLNEICKLLAQAETLVGEAELIADEYGLEFDVNFGGYGMGGTYYSEKYVEEQGSRYMDAGWNTSSQSC